jgi:hypothetical protein
MAQHIEEHKAERIAEHAAQHRHFEVVAEQGGHSEVLLVTDSEAEAIRHAQEHAGRYPHASVAVSEEAFDNRSRRFVARRVWSCRSRPTQAKKAFVMSPLTGRFIVKR